MDELIGPVLEPGTGEAAVGLVIFLHGYGADGNDLIDIGRLWAKELPGLAFTAPNAPFACGMSPVGREWFPLHRLARDEYDAGVYLAAPYLDGFIKAECARRKLSPGQLALVGFSQGTMMALHVGLRLRETLAGILGFSGALGAAGKLPSEITSRPAVSLLHGDSDQVVPVAATHHAAEVLKELNVPVTTHVYRGLGHGISQSGLAQGLKFLRDRFS